jgi:MraZ protein
VVTGDRWHGLRLLQGQVPIDAVGGFALPDGAAKRLGPAAVLTAGEGPCLHIYPAGAWEQHLSCLNSLPDVRPEARLLIQLVQSNAVTVRIPTDCAVVLPLFLRGVTGLEDQALVVSADDRIELWDPGRWKSQHRESDSLRHGVA